MTAVMVAGKSRLPRRYQYPLPPRQIVETLVRRTGMLDESSNDTRDLLTDLAHCAYGAGAGAVYGAIAPRLPKQPVLNGMAYGVTVWAASYLGWLPAMRFPAAATREPGERNALMISAHLVWGATLGLLESRFRPPHASPHSVDREKSVITSAEADVPRQDAHPNRTESKR
jgi:uncharacterized membrane protein YagU involved in acid resistance